MSPNTERQTASLTPHRVHEYISSTLFSVLSLKANLRQMEWQDCKRKKKSFISCLIRGWTSPPPSPSSSWSSSSLSLSSLWSPSSSSLKLWHVLLCLCWLFLCCYFLRLLFCCCCILMYFIMNNVYIWVDVFIFIFLKTYYTFNDFLLITHWLCVIILCTYKQLGRMQKSSEPCFKNRYFNE